MDAHCVRLSHARTVAVVDIYDIDKGDAPLDAAGKASYHANSFSNQILVKSISQARHIKSRQMLRVVTGTST
jgi:hypothetical protein